MRTPRLVVGLAALAAAFFALPLLGLVAAAPWRTAGSMLLAPQVTRAAALSLVAATAAVALGTALAFPLAWVLARTRFPGRRWLRGLVLVPMVLPPVVAGVGLLAAFGRRGLLGGALEAAGVTIPFTTAAVVLAATFVSAPFLVVTLEAGLAGLDRRLEDAAATLGASPARILATVVLPGLKPSLAAGVALAWTRALGEFGATITFAGNLRGRTQTMPLAVYEILQTDAGAAILLSVVLLLVSLLAVVAVRGGLFRDPA
ncbi:MAG TPA: ABC transporter permease [Gemmatimonadota bacterium]|nr:ABC transporter permease [Gemmatimonadota bacterium]